MNARPHCPNCNSGATQTAKMIILSGYRNWSGGGVGMGMHGGFGVGVGGGVSASALAQMLHPGPIPSYLITACAVFVLFLASCVLRAGIDASGIVWSVAQILLFAVLTPLLFLRRRHQRSNWRDTVDRLEHTWVCRTCCWKF